MKRYRASCGPGDASGWYWTEKHRNDRTVEGLSVPSLRCFSVQYHPEASPGPHDARYLFTRFYRYLTGEAEI